MRRSIVTTYTSKVRTPVLSLGPLPSSSGPWWPGLGMRLSLRRRQGLRGPLEVGTKPRTIRTWQACWISSFEKYRDGRIAKLVICLPFDIIAFDLFCYFHRI